jgi:hypothetical protein
MLSQRLRLKFHGGKIKTEVPGSRSLVVLFALTTMSEEPALSIFTLKMKAADSFKTLVITFLTTLWYSPEDYYYIAITSLYIYVNLITYEQNWSICQANVLALKEDELYYVLNTWKVGFVFMLPRPGQLLPGVKVVAVWTDHSGPFNAEFENMWISTSIPQFVFAVWYFQTFGAGSSNSQFLETWIKLWVSVKIFTLILLYAALSYIFA